MKFFNLGVPEIIFIIIIALIIFGPGNMIKTAKEAGTLIRKVTKSPYWKEVWATKREIDELPKMLREEAHLDETIRDLNRESSKITSSLASSMSDLMKEVNKPLEIPVSEEIKKTENTPAPEAKPEDPSI